MAKVLGIDFGNSRIGLALGEKGVASPLKIINGKNWHIALKDIEGLVEENSIACIVLGIPEKETIGVNKFQRFLKENIDLPIKFLNEDFTSKEALEYSIQMGYSKKGRKYLDDVAACMLLERFFEKNDCED